MAEVGAVGSALTLSGGIYYHHGLASPPRSQTFPRHLFYPDYHVLVRVEIGQAMPFNTQRYGDMGDLALDRRKASWSTSHHSSSREHPGVVGLVVQHVNISLQTLDLGDDKNDGAGEE